MSQLLLTIGSLPLAVPNALSIYTAKGKANWISLAGAHQDVLGAEVKMQPSMIMHVGSRALTKYANWLRTTKLQADMPLPLCKTLLRLILPFPRHI